MASFLNKSFQSDKSKILQNKYKQYIVCFHLYNVEEKKILIYDLYWDRVEMTGNEHEGSLRSDENCLHLFFFLIGV